MLDEYLDLILDEQVMKHKLQLMMMMYLCKF